MGSRIAALLLGSLLALVVIELGLRGIGSLSERRDRAPSGEYDRTILCIGDSHTFGTSTTFNQAYPGQLRHWLERMDRTRKYRVVNRGVPGANTAQMAHILTRAVERERPDLVVFWGGVNNRWNYEDPGRIRERRQGALAELAGRLRIVRFLRTLRIDREYDRRIERGLSGGDWAVEAKRLKPSGMGSDARSTDPRYAQDLINDLDVVRERLAAKGIPWLVLSYPLREPGAGGETFRNHAALVAEFSETRGVPLVDSFLDLERAFEKSPNNKRICETSEPNFAHCMFVNDMGPHPTAVLYNYISHSVARAALRVLGCDGCSQDAGGR